MSLGIGDAWREKLDGLAGIWLGRFPRGAPRSHSLIEKLLCTLSIVFALFSAANLCPKRWRWAHEFMDLYVLVWAALLSLIFFSTLIPWSVAIFLAAYRVFDILTYRVYFLLVKSQEKPWESDRFRRSLAIVLVNFYELVLAFAILYLRTHSIASAGSLGSPVVSRSIAFYFSLVTMTTVGYGDYVPASALGRLLVVAQLSSVVVLLIFLLPALVSTFSPVLARNTQ